jgi:glycerol-3-phosphate dehydrogenase (NAD(P)+)
LLCRRDHEVLLWARNPDTADEVNEQRANSSYLPDVRLPARLSATADLEQAARHAELLVVGVPTGAFRETLENLRPHVTPWIPVVSLSKGLERGTHLRMTEGRTWPGRSWPARPRPA